MRWWRECQGKNGLAWHASGLTVPIEKPEDQGMIRFPAIKRANTLLYCRRWKPTVMFYRDRLGLEIAYQCDWLVEFHLCSTSYLSVADQSRASIPSAEGKGITLSFEIDHLSEIHRSFTESGLAPTAIRPWVMGADVFYLFDPEGNRIEFWCPCP
jgi:catechol 2,3-dioxygenase-like lactoylglutathione lyase family enzyme